MTNVPVNNGKIPYFSASNGSHSVPKKNSLNDTTLKKSIVSNKRTKIIPVVVNILKYAQRASDFSITCSLIAVMLLYFFSKLIPSSSHPIFKTLACLIVIRVRQRYISYFTNKIFCVFNVILNESNNLRFFC